MEKLQIPCSHACVVLTIKHLSIKPYVSPLYLNKTLSSIYRGLINSLGDSREWKIPEDVRSIVILPPNIKCVQLVDPRRLEFMLKWNSKNVLNMVVVNDLAITGRDVNFPC